MIKTIALAVMLAVSAGCIVPEPAVSTAVRTPKALPFTVEVFPRVTFEGTAVRVGCYHPDPDERSRMLLEVPGMISIDVPHDRKRISQIIERVECGEWIVTCTRYTNNRREHRSAKLTVRGRCDAKEDR